MKVWITKYALTEGIFEKEVETCFDISPKMVSDKDGSYKTCYHKPDWHETRKDAVAQAEKMRIAKIASLKKQVKKLQGKRFE